MGSREHTTAITWIISAIACAILVFRLALRVDVFSPTTDEPADIGAAVSMYEAGKSIAGVSHPPLARWVPAVSLYLDGVRLPECRGKTTIEKEDVAYALGTRALYSGVKPAKVILRHARLLMLIFPILSLFFLHLLTRRIAGPWPAALAVVFFSLDPTLLGHALWICDDVSAGTGFLAGIYFAVRWLDTPTIRNAVYLGVAAGLAVAIKFNCLLLLPLIGLMVAIRWRSQSVSFAIPEDEHKRKSDKPRQRLLQLALSMFSAFVCLWATYLFNLGPLGDQNVIGHPAAWEHLPAWIRNTPLPMPSFFLGLARQMAHNHAGQTAYLNGHTSDHGWWYYFPEVLVLKTPLAVLTALLIALFAAAISLSRQPPTPALRRSEEPNRTPVNPTLRNTSEPASVTHPGVWKSLSIPSKPVSVSVAIQCTLFPAAAYLIISMLTSHLALGIRYMLPILPLLYGFIAIVFCNRRLIWLLCVLIGITAIETAIAAPDDLAYFNLLAGGTPGGSRFAADSNIGWGQDIYLLADWIHAHHTTDYALRLSARRHIPLLREVGIDEQSLNRNVHGRLLFLDINARLIEGRLPWITRHQPIAHIGSSIDVYDLRTDTESPSEPNDPPPPDDPANRTGKRDGAFP